MPDDLPDDSGRNSPLIFCWQRSRFTHSCPVSSAVGYSFGVTTRHFNLIASAGAILREDLELIHNKVSRLARSHLNPRYPVLYSLASFFARDARFDLGNALVLSSGNPECYRSLIKASQLLQSLWYRPHSEETH